MQRNVSNDTPMMDEKVPVVEIPDECRKDLIRAMKIGYYKEFYKKGLISSEELDELLKMQSVPEEMAA